MQGYRDKDGNLHLILEKNTKESLDLFTIITVGVEGIKKWGKPECTKAAEKIQWEYKVLFITDKHIPSSEDNPIVVRK